MRLRIGTCWVSLIGLTVLAGCTPTAQTYTGPGCLLYLYPLPGLAGSPLPVRADTIDIASTWHETAASAKVVYGTWRFFSEPTFVGFAGDYKAPTDRVEFRQPLKIGSLKCIQLEPPSSPVY
jgi:hypothetical protein